MAKCNNEEGQLHYLLTESKASNNLKALRPVLVHSEDRFQLIRGLRSFCTLHREEEKDLDRDMLTTNSAVPQKDSQRRHHI